MPLKLEDRELWEDGVTSVDPDKLTQYILKLAPKGLLNRLAVNKLTPAVREYNSVADHPIEVKTELSDFSLNWSLPDAYKYLDIDEYLIGLGSRVEQDELFEKRIQRLSHEIYVFKQLQLDEVLKLLIYIVDQLRETKSIWGVGRGSSCSSYLLFLLGLHEVDPVRYDIDLEDFIQQGN